MILRKIFATLILLFQADFSIVIIAIILKEGQIESGIAYRLRSMLPPWLASAIVVRSMGRNWKWHAAAWTVLGSYISLALLPAGAIVYCILEPGHLAIEFAHNDCPQVICNNSSVKQLAASSKQTPACVDTALTFSDEHLRKKSHSPLTLPPRTFLAILPNLPTCQIYHYPVYQISRRSPQDCQPTNFLCTVVLLI